MSNKVKIGVSVSALLLGGVLYFMRSGEVNDLVTRTDYNTRLGCRSCGHEFSAELDVVDRPPFECPECKKLDAWHVWRCNECKNRFVPEPEGDPPRAPMIPRCPECGGQSTGRVPGSE